MRWSDAEVRRALGLPGGDPGLVYTGVSTDTRALEPGNLFVALRGSRYDGHAFVEQAVELGASGVVVDDSRRGAIGASVYSVDDTLYALGELARARRERFRGPVVAITGTSGKTSAKEMVAAVLARAFRTHATSGNLNNLIGVPLTVLNAPADTEALVVEAGASVPGEIPRYREILKPTIAAVTSVAAGHLEGFGSMERILDEKTALLSGCPLAVVGNDPPVLAERARALAGRVIVVGAGSAEAVEPETITLLPSGRAQFGLEGMTVTLQPPGRHQVLNAMIAWSIGKELGIPPADMQQALEGVSLPAGRGDLTRHGELLILHDGYNANPQSFRATIALARDLREATGRRLVFLAGTMRELGTESDAWHRTILGELHALDPDVLGLAGNFVAAAVEGGGEMSNRKIVLAKDATGLGEQIVSRISGNELVVLKASRGEAFERILPQLISRAAPAPRG